MVIKVSRKVPGIVSLIDAFGSFAEPFLNMALVDENVEGAWKKYLVALKLIWRNEFSLALNEVNAGLKFCQKDKTLYFLLLSRKLFLLMGMKDPQGDMVYVDLLRNEAKIPFVARRYVMSILSNYRPIREMEENVFLKKVRIWSKKYANDHRSQIFLLLGKARDKVENGKNSEGFSFFLKSFRIAKDIPHPLGITDALNDMAWYMRNKHPCWSYGIAKQAVYQAGWYRENVSSVFYTFDTLLECQKIIDDFQLYENASLMILVSKYLPCGSGRETQEHYRDKIESCQRIIPSFEVSRYKNSRSLRKYLKSKVCSATYAHKISGVGKSNILAILNGRVRKVKGETLQRLTKALGIRPSPKNSPFPVWNEYVKANIKEAFSRSIEKLKEISQEQRQINFISTYMAFFNRRKSLSYLSGKEKLKEAFSLLKDIRKFKNFMLKRYETMEFVNNMVNEMHPFLQARKDLAKEFIQKLSRASMERLVKMYVEMSAARPFIVENKREIIDRFVRDYVRYDIKWGMRLRSLKSLQCENPQYSSLERIIQTFRLRRMPVILAYYALEDGKGRKQLLNVLKKIR